MNPAQSSSKYIPDPSLSAVIELVLELDMPLLVTGDPGTGKTRLAYFVAQQLGLDEGPLIFNTKTDSQARDLFYTYDAVRHFRDAGLGGSAPPAMNYISFNALGKAIIESGQKRAVVLIDEIDKAPRDFSNDLLFEFEHLAFNIKEATVEETVDALGKQASVNSQGFVSMAKQENRPILILTSNSEKNLPDAFMRRVLYHHIEFPNKERLTQIVAANVPDLSSQHDKLVHAAIEHFIDIREHKRLRKSPATAELLSWIHVLNKQQIDLEEGLKASGDRQLKERILRTYSLIAKNKDDFASLKKDLGI